MRSLTFDLVAAALCGLLFVAVPQLVAAPTKAVTKSEIRASILAYHRFGPAVSDSMTIRTSSFKWQLAYLRDHHYPVVPLRTLVTFLRHQGPPPPPHAVVITIDDGHQSVFTEAFPLIREYGIPVTLFIYPSAISNARYAMTWEELQTLRDTRLFDIQSHTFWHPNFKIEARRLSPDAYRAFATMQFCKARTRLHDKLGVDADLFAWPFGITDGALIPIAQSCGYAAGLTLGGRAARDDDALMLLPRFLMGDTTSPKTFASMLPGAPGR
ncbi:MAG: polysaccharide deacetylase family protein [Acidobacteriota bacterium]